MIFVDTNALVALADPRDGLHTRADADLRRLRRGRLVVCEAVVAESCFLMPHPIERARLDAVIARLEIDPWQPTEAGPFRRAVFAWLSKYAEHEPDWADGALAVAASRDRTARVWTYDSEFRTTWRRLDGSKIPLAPSGATRSVRA